jgi:hypothetical protein
MTPITSLLGALWSHDVRPLEAVIERTEITDDLFTPEEALTLWETGWQVQHTAGEEGTWHGWDERVQPSAIPWPPEPEVWQPSSASTPLWQITVGMFLRMLKTAYPWLPGVPDYEEFRDIEDE